MRLLPIPVSLLLLALMCSATANGEAPVRSDSSMAAHKARLSEAEVMHIVTTEAKRRKIRLERYSTPIISFDSLVAHGRWTVFYNENPPGLDHCLFFNV